MDDTTYNKTMKKRLEWVDLGDVCKIVRDKPHHFDGTKKYIPTKAITNHTVESFQNITFENKPSRANIVPQIYDVGFAVMKGTRKIVFIDHILKDCIFSTGFCFLRCSEKILPRYLFHFACSAIFQENKDRFAIDGIMGGIKKENILKIRVPLRSIKTQKEIVRILDTFTELKAELVARQKQYEYYREKLLTFDERERVEVNFRALGAICKISTGKLNVNANVVNGKYKFFTCSKAVKNIDKYRWDTEALMIAGNGEVGIVHYYVGKFEAYQRTYVLTTFDRGTSVKYLYYFLSSKFATYAKNHTQEGSVPYITINTVASFKIPIPPMKTQKRIVSILDTFDALVNDISIGLPAEINARQKQYEHYRERLLTFN